MHGGSQAARSHTCPARLASFMFYYIAAALKGGCSHQIFKLGDKEKIFIPGSGLIPATALSIPTGSDKLLAPTPHLALPSPRPHPHYCSAANPVCQILLPWTLLRKSYWCCTFLSTQGAALSSRLPLSPYGTTSAAFSPVSRPPPPLLRPCCPAVHNQRRLGIIAQRNDCLGAPQTTTTKQTKKKKKPDKKGGPQ